MSDIQDYFEDINKKTGNLLIRIYLNKIENRITFITETGYYLEILKSEMTKLLGRTKHNITKDEYCENVLRLKTTEVVLVHCNIVNTDFLLKTFNLVLSCIEVWFTDQNFKPLDIEDKINITLVVKK